MAASARFSWLGFVIIGANHHQNIPNVSVGGCVCGVLAWVEFGGAFGKNKMAFRNFENVFCFDEVRNDFSQEIEKSSI